MKQLVYLSPLPWNSFAQRPHKFVEWFHKKTQGKVLWIDPYPSRFPLLSDFKRLKNASIVQNVESAVPSWLSVIKPRSLPIEPMLGSGLVNGFFWRDIFEQIKLFTSQAESLIAIGKPSVLALQLLKKFPHIDSLYDSMDDFSAFFTGLSSFAMARRERLLFSSAKHVWVSSTKLKQTWEKSRPDIHLVYNALDEKVSLFNFVKSPSRDKKIFGYVGTIASWFDWDWVCELALQYPQDEIRIIGPVFKEPTQIIPDNITLLPACEHSKAMQKMMDFDVGLIPFIKNDLTSSVDPIKYYEYRVLGLPVISTNFGEMVYREHESGVFLSCSINDISLTSKRALGFKQGQDEANTFAQKNSWEGRFNETGLLL